MIDPATVIGGIGFGLAVLSFLSSSVSNLVRQEGEARHCQSRLKAYSYELQDRQKEMLNWISIWYGKRGFSKETYYYCWGEDGYDEVKRRLESIAELIASITVHLRLSETARPINLSGSEKREWEEILQGLNAIPRRQPRERRFLGKIAFTISENMKLGEELTRLKSLTQGFIGFSRIKFRERQGFDVESNPTHDELRLLDAKRRCIENLSEFANGLYAIYQEKMGGFEWDLELRTPDWDGDATQTDIPGSIAIDFLLQGACSCRFWTAQRFRIHYRNYNTGHSLEPNHEPGTIGQAMLDQVKSCERRSGLRQSGELFTILEAPKSKGRPTRGLLSNGSDYAVKRKAYEQERTIAALGIANWLFLLWKTPWMSAPCLCSIHRTRLSGSRGPYVLQPYPTSHTDPPCFPTGAAAFTEQRLLLLGHLLAELALGMPLGLGKAPDGRPYFIKDDRNLTKEELLQDLRRVCGDVGLIQAVRYCLVTEDRGPHARVERLHEDAKNIIQPILRHVQVLRDHAESQRDRRWLRNINRYLEADRDNQLGPPFEMCNRTA